MKQTKKKQKVTLTKSPSKNGDIRALFSTATKSTKNYTKLINNLDIDSSLPTKIINLLVDLTVEQANSVNKCYFCDNVCDCLIFQKVKSKKSLSPLAILNDKKTYLPDIQLIDNLSAEMLLKYVENTADGVPQKESFSLCDEDKSIKQEDDEIATNFDLKFDFDSITDSLEEEKVIVKTDEVVKDKNFDIGDLDDIFADSSPLEVKEKDEGLSDPNKTLEYFGLDSFDDIFVISDDEISEKKSDNKVKLKNVTKINNMNSPIKKLERTKTENTNSPISERPTSPSILSGRTKPVVSPVMSPILCSQRNKYKSSKLNAIQSSTPVTTAKKKLCLGTRKEAKIPKTSVCNLEGNAEITNKSMFTITQLVNMINNSDTKSPLPRNCTEEPEKKNAGLNERSASPILLTQRDRANSIDSANKSTFSVENRIENKSDRAIEMETSPILLTQGDIKKNISRNLQEQRKSISKLNTTSSIIIPDSDSDFEDNSEICDFKSKEVNHKINTPNKRKLDEDDDEIMPSPYFNSKKQKLDDNKFKAATLQEKVLAALSSGKSDVFNNNSQINFMFNSPFEFPKENKDPSPFNSPEKESDGEKLRNNLAKLEIFRHGSRVSPKKSIMKDSTNTSHDILLSTRKLRFDDSDDDFVSDNKTRGKPRADTKIIDKRAVKHKVKTVSGLNS